jgi:hypothetical protein
VLIAIGQFNTLALNLDGCEGVVRPAAFSQLAEVELESFILWVGEVGRNLIVDREVPELLKVVQAVAVEIDTWVVVQVVTLVALNVVVTPSTLGRSGRKSKEFFIIFCRSVLFRVHISIFGVLVGFGIFFIRCAIVPRFVSVVVVVRLIIVLGFLLVVI